MSRSISIYLDDNTRRRLKMWSAVSGVTMSDLVFPLIIKAMNDASIPHLKEGELFKTTIVKNKKGR